MGAALFGYTKLYGQVPGGQAEFLRVPQAHYGPIKVPEGPAGRPLPVPLRRAAHRVAGRRSTRRRARRRQRRRPRARPDRRDGLPDRPAPRRGHGHRGRPRARAPGARAVATACRRSTSTATDDVAGAVRELTGGRGPDAVIDAVGMEAHGAPVGKLAHRLAGLLPDAVAQQGHGDGRRRPPQRAARGDRARPPRRHRLAVRRLRRDRRPDDDAADLRQAAHAAHGPGQRPALDRRHPAAARATTTIRSASTTFATHHVPLDEAPQAYEMFQKKEDGAFKVVFRP